MEDLSQIFAAAKELLLAKPLRDKDLMAANNPITLKAAQSWPIPLSNVTFSFGAGASLDITLFNDEDDKDADGYLAVKDSPILLNTATDAYLKYAAGISAKANAQTSLSNIGFDLDLSASGQASTVYYKRHANTEAINQAFIHDMAAFRTPFRFEDIAALEANDALVFTAGGKASCSLKIKWSDLITAGMGALAGSLPVPLTLDLDLTPTLTAAFDISVSDDFSFFIKKQADGQCLVSIRKTRNRSIAGSVGASVGIAFSNPDELNTQLNQLYSKIIQSILGHSPDEILAAIQKVQGQVADASQQQLVNAALKLLKLDSLPDKLDQLVKKIDDLAQKIPDALQKIASASASFSFSYEYSRIEENKELLSIQLDVQNLKNYHADLLRMKLGRMVDDMRAGSFPFTLISYLNEKTLKVHSSWGFGLKAFNLTLLDGKTYIDKNEITRTNLAGNQQVTLDRTLGYKWQLGKEQGDWFGQLTAEMPDFSHTLTPTLDEFEYSLLLDSIVTDPKVDVGDLRGWLDGGSIWGALKPEDLDNLTTKYQQAGGIIGQAATSEMKLVIKPSQLQSIFQLIAQNGWGERNMKYLSRALAASMGYLKGYRYRGNPQIRVSGYAGLWLDYLNNPDRDESDYAANAQDAFEALGNPDNLASLEGDTGNRMQGITYAGLIHLNPNIFTALRAFVVGITGLYNNIQGRVSYDRFGDSYDNIKGAFGELFLVKTIGYFLLLNADDLGMRKDIGASLTIGYGEEQKIIFATI